MNLADATRERIFELCDERGITVNKLCTEGGISQSTLNNIINTGSNNPTLSTIKKVCDTLEITLAEFFTSEFFDKLEPEVK